MYTGMPPSRHGRAFFALGVLMICCDMLVTSALMTWAHHSNIVDLTLSLAARRFFKIVFTLCAVALLPFLVAQVRTRPPPRWTSLLLSTGCFIAALTWIGVAFAVRHAELAGPKIMYIVHAACSILMMLIVASSNNACRRAYHRHRAVPSDWNRMELDERCAP